ncbi:unnamed protein product [Nyctereutes procyonoides]|uniref:(raccoon dog) hypothetical protein n=1 Tax=Nyctereutes procyonoides TaxID=34880 RepID=A0A811Y8L7_NYCPR|nr:unnamed protein product [Nyctereutes procyonoides]
MWLEILGLGVMAVCLVIPCTATEKSAAYYPHQWSMMQRDRRGLENIH